MGYNYGFKNWNSQKIGKEIGSQFLSFLLDQFRVQFLIELDGLIIF